MRVCDKCGRPADVKVSMTAETILYESQRLLMGETEPEWDLCDEHYKILRDVLHEQLELK